ncbi:hypothetical protein FGADI_2558 [Fusarium gaditjirri]|uniref:Uncharacterized protein n=1 Tax=Fusarium gaditjirri TaxID=282569 RepID=A0A8H4TIM1_9HYPO|nr:hypothetical protein FGADI_2558 [Fusarium gaditjirri]
MINTRLGSIEADLSYNYPTCDVLRNIAKMSVLVMATEEQDGRSAPTTFDSTANSAKLIHSGGLNKVETDLETAIEHLMPLEKHEEAAFGPQTDPVAAMGSHRDLNDRLGWRGDTNVCPSSDWVDPEKYKTWRGGVPVSMLA